jgi:hypothetical protein
MHAKIMTGKSMKGDNSSVLKGLNRNPNILFVLTIHLTLYCQKAKLKVWHRKLHLLSTQQTQKFLKSKVSNLVNSLRAVYFKKDPAPLLCG